MLLSGLLILATFADTTFRAENTHAAFDSLANSDCYYYNGANGSTRAYFREQSYGAYDPHFDVVGPVVLPYSSADYAMRDVTGNERYLADFIMDAVGLAQGMGINYADYDADNDGVIDFVYIIFQGHGANDSQDMTCIWPHEWDLESVLAYNLTKQDEYYVNYDFQADSIISENLPRYDGKTIGKYACSAEVKYADKRREGIGVMCHEFSHVLGLADYYIGDYSPGDYSLMATGSYNNWGNTPPNWSCYDKYSVGWLTPVIQRQRFGMLSHDTCYMVVPGDTLPALRAQCPDTCYYLEYRTQSGWDSFLPSGGELVWRVIYDSLDWVKDEVNLHIPRMQLVKNWPATGITEWVTRDSLSHIMMINRDIYIQRDDAIFDLQGRKIENK